MPKQAPSKLKLLACLLATWAWAAAAAPPAEAQLTKLYAEKNWAQALTLIETELGSKPADTQMQIQKGVVLTNLNRSADALVVFRKLTAEHPELPGPHNNVAVLLAARGDFEEARQALERAIRTHPSYATAHENLGDLYSHMAAEAYRKALRYDKQVASAKPKLALVDGLTTATSATEPIKLKTAADITAAPTAPTKPLVAPAASAALVVAAKPLAVVPPPAPPVKPSAATVTAPASAAVAKAAVAKAPVAPPSEPAKPVALAASVGKSPALLITAPGAAAASAAKPLAAQAAAPAASSSKQIIVEKAEPDTREITNAVNAWAAAWSKRDLDGYFASYTADFKGKAPSHANWKADRQARIGSKQRIEVTVSDLKVKFKGNLAEVHLMQKYESEALRNTMPKTLTLENVGGKWLIRRESASR